MSNSWIIFNCTESGNACLEGSQSKPCKFEVLETHWEVADETVLQKSRIWIFDILNALFENSEYSWSEFLFSEVIDGEESVRNGPAGRQEWLRAAHED